jgi:hypothetical protein
VRGGAFEMDAHEVRPPMGGVLTNVRFTSTPAVREASSASFDMIGFGLVDHGCEVIEAQWSEVFLLCIDGALCIGGAACAHAGAGRELQRGDHQVRGG